MSQHYERTHYMALMECRFGVRYNEMNAGLYLAIDRLLSILNLFFGAAVIGSAMKENPGIAATAGVIVVLVSIVQMVWSPARIGAEHREMFRGYTLLAAEAASLNLEQLDSRLAELRQMGPSGFDALNGPAQNDVLLSYGHADRVAPLSPGERLAAFLS